MVGATAADADAVAMSLERSLQSTCHGLAAFLRSLEQAGLREALKPYRQMQLTLLQQRAWAASHRRAELMPLWLKLAETAGAIHAIMDGFAAVMAGLKDIERGAAMASGPVSASEPPAAEALPGDIAALACVLNAISLAPGRAARLKANGDGGPPADRLLAAGILEMRGNGRARSLRLSATAQRNVAACLANAMKFGRHAGVDQTIED